MANSSVDGLVSGLDTTTIISQLMQIERQPQLRLQGKVLTAQTVIKAYQGVNAKFAALGAAADALGELGTWQAVRATSSSDAVTVTATAGALPGSMTFDVDEVARAAAKVSSGTVSSTSTTVATGPSLTITGSGGSPVTVDLTDRSLAGVVSAINAEAGAGVKAAAVQVAPGVYRLQLTSTTTGSASEFTVSGLDEAVLQASGQPTLQTLVAGTDARLIVGAGSAGQYEVTSATNTFKDFLPGVTLTVKGEATAVDVDVVADAGAVADKVNAMVAAANAALGEIAKLTGYDASTKAAGPLLSDFSVRQLAQNVLQAVSTALAGVGDMGAAGVQLTKGGQLSFDKAKFLAAYAADPDKMARLFRPGGSAAGAALSANVEFALAADGTRPGEYGVVVTTAAERAAVDLGSSFAAPPSVSVKVAGGAAQTYAATGTDPHEVADGLNAFFATNGLAATATVEGGSLILRSHDYGSAAKLTVAVDGGAETVDSGVDVGGTINGNAATGIGQLLSAPTTDKAAGGLALRITVTPDEVAAASGTLNLGTFTYAPGLAQRLSSVAASAIDSVSGSLTLAVKSRESGIDSLNKQISAWDVRLQKKQDQLRRQFAALETALGRLRDQSNWLAGQLASLPTSSSQ